MLKSLPQHENWNGGFCGSKWMRGYLDTSDGVLLSGQCVLYKNIKAETDFIIVQQEYVISMHLFNWNWLLTCDKFWSNLIKYFIKYIYSEEEKDLIKETLQPTHPSLLQMTWAQLSKRDLKIPDHSDTLLRIKPLSTNQTLFLISPLFWSVISSELIYELLNLPLNYSNF